MVVPNNSYREVYVVDQAVGAGCPNKRSDVLLVQYLLNVLAEKRPPYEAIRPADEMGLLPMTGICDQRTIKYIKNFQRYVKEKKVNILEDGRIDPIMTGGSRSGGSRTYYTIVGLNAGMRTRRGDQFTPYQDPMLPRELENELFMVFNKHKLAA
jgi:hypothetical protein